MNEKCLGREDSCDNQTIVGSPSIFESLTMKNYRLYSFVNTLYMSQIQWGIQTAHCVSTMMSAAFRAQGEDGGAERLADVLAWAEQSPTIMICGF